MSLEERLSKLERQYGETTVLTIVEDGHEYSKQQRRAALEAGKAEAQRTGSTIIVVDLTEQV